MPFFIVTVVKTSNLTHLNIFFFVSIVTGYRLDDREEQVLSPKLLDIYLLSTTSPLSLLSIA
jgi:hypothetical protein